MKLRHALLPAALAFTAGVALGLLEAPIVAGAVAGLFVSLAYYTGIGATT